MNILVVTPDLPAPPTSGGRARTFHLLRELGRRNTIDLLAPEPSDPEALSCSRKICRHLTTYPSVKEDRRSRRRRLWRSVVTGRLHHPHGNAREAIERILESERYDIIHFVTPYLFPSLPTGTRVATVVDFFGTSIGIRRELHTSPGSVSRLKTRMRYRFAVRGERWVLGRVDVAFSVSNTNREYLAALAPGARIEVVPSGVDTEYFSPLEISEEPARLAFVGDMSFRPNVEGALFLVREILPRLRAEGANVHVDLVGRSPLPAVVDLGKLEGVRVTGGVEDVRPYLSRAAVVVVPLLGGSGVRTKTLEAMAMGRAVVSTSMGVEGLEALRAGDVKVVDGQEAFARAVLELLASREERARMGRDARATVVEHYAWDASARTAERVYASIYADGSHRGGSNVP